MNLILPLTPFQESEQNEIELKEDNADALEGVLRYIYGCKIEDRGQKTWQYWLDLFETADKYLEPELSLEASIAFRMLALDLGKKDVEAICEILQILQDTERYYFFKSFAVGLTMRHLELLDNKQFRAQVYSCKRVMFKMVERLSFAIDLEPVELLCDVHGEEEFYRKDDTGHYRFGQCMQ
jgi:hypothetical protein